jgi:hypothetical protein
MKRKGIQVIIFLQILLAFTQKKFPRSCDEMRQAHRLACVEAFFIRLVDEDQAGRALLHLITKRAENLSSPHNSPTHLLSTILGSV